MPSFDESMCAGPIICGVVAALLLFYPISVKQVHPVVQIAICSCLSTIGFSSLISFAACDNTICSSCHSWVMGSTLIFSLLANVFFPVLGAVVGMGTAAGLVVDAIVSSTTDSSFVQHLFVALGVIGGVATMFVWREMILHWQLFAPPVVGGYLAALAITTISEDMNSGVIFYSVWSAAILVSVALHIRKRRVSSWLEKKHAEAVYSKESQIVQVMRSADPKMSADEFEKLKERLLVAVDGEREQVDRVVFGGGLY